MNPSVIYRHDDQFIRPYLNLHFEKLFHPPDVFERLEFSTHLYFGSSVLHAFYQPKKWEPKDYDVAVPVNSSNPTYRKDFLDKIHVKPGYSVKLEKEHEYIGSTYLLAKVTCDATKKCVVEVVGIDVGKDNASTVKLHSTLNRVVDVKITSLSWDPQEKRLHYPSQLYANLEKRTSFVDMHDFNCVSETEERKYQNRVTTRRIAKYDLRDFTVYNDSGIYSMKLFHGEVKVKLL